VTLVDAILGNWPRHEVPVYALAQVLGALAGVAIAHVMFSEPLFQVSTKPRAGVAQAFAEFVATFGLLAIVFFTSRRGSAAVAVAVGSYIAAAYWFTSSTSFANPAVTLARAFTNTFTGIRPRDLPGFLAGEAVGVVAFAVFAHRVLPRRNPDRSEDA
jgi:glycerol uptake facilitator-like aquaporin